jgi:hypothetical protein
VTDWFWSTAFYTATLVALLGALGVIWPLRWLHRKSRPRAALMLLAGIAVVVTIAVMTPAKASAATRSGIDEFAPEFHFQEHHTIIVSAPPDRAYAAIKAVTADEIGLFHLFTSIRRFGRSGPESILNAPGQQPILDVATRTGFLLLLDRPGTEVVIGSIVVAPPGVAQREGPRRQFTGEDFTALSQPGFAKATMNFRIEDLGNGTSRIETETRVFATDNTALRRFTPYWRIIFPGSWILRATWLDAIKTRAEQVSS